VTFQPIEPARSLRDVAEVRLGVAVGGLFATTAVLVSSQVPTAVFLTVLFLQTGVWCLVLDGRGAVLLLGLTGWALGTGFAVNRLGMLTFSAPDLARLAAFAIWAQAGPVVRDTMRAVGVARRRRDGWSHAQRPAAGLGVRPRRRGAMPGRAGPRSVA
jgi:hypothetical protein